MSDQSIELAAGVPPPGAVPPAAADKEGTPQTPATPFFANVPRDLNRLCIEDPFQTDYNVARTVTVDGLFTVCPSRSAGLLVARRLIRSTVPNNLSDRSEARLREPHPSCVGRDRKLTSMHSSQSWSRSERTTSFRHRPRLTTGTPRRRAIGGVRLRARACNPPCSRPTTTSERGRSPTEFRTPKAVTPGPTSLPTSPADSRPTSTLINCTHILCRTIRPRRHPTVWYLAQEDKC